MEGAIAVARDEGRTKLLGEINEKLAAMNGTPMPGRNGLGKTIVVTKRAKRDPSTAILAYVRANPASRSEDITTATGCTKEQVRALVGKGLRKKGERRGTRYSVSGRG